MTIVPVFDGHNDVLSRLHGNRPQDPARAFIDGYDAAIDLPKSVAGGFAGGFFAVYIPPLEVDPCRNCCHPLPARNHTNDHCPGL